jgi:hypothetical protein
MLRRLPRARVTRQFSGVRPLKGSASRARQGEFPTRLHACAREAARKKDRFSVARSGKSDHTRQTATRCGPGEFPTRLHDALVNPTLELHDSTGALIASNDNWVTTIIGGISYPQAGLR